MPWKQVAWAWRMGRRQRSSAWGALLDRHDLLLAALSLQQTGGVRVVVFEHLHAPEGLVHLSEQDDWLAQGLQGLRGRWPATAKTLALALGEERCRQGVLEGLPRGDPQRLLGEVRLEAAAVWGVGPDAVGFDFRTEDPGGEAGLQVHWAAGLLEPLQDWQRHVRNAGWRLPLVEPEMQAALRAATCLSEDTLRHWAVSPQDWQFSLAPQRTGAELPWSRLQASPLWRPLVACGAALGALS